MQYELFTIYCNSLSLIIYVILITYRNKNVSIRQEYGVLIFPSLLVKNFLVILCVLSTY